MRGKYKKIQNNNKTDGIPKFRIGGREIERNNGRRNYFSR